jgi:hypothetical protein
MSTDSALSYGTLGTQASTAGIESQAGVTMAMLELNWGSFEPRPGEVSAPYLATMRSCLRAYQAAGQRVTLGLGLHYPPSWLFCLPGRRYVDQHGDVSDQADFVFSQAVRAAAARYLALVAAALPLPDLWAIRLTSGGDGEMLYPPGGTYWAFGPPALTGTGLAAGMTPNPYPDWRPGQPGLRPDQIDRWVNWYVGGLANVTTWQMQTLSRLGFTGYYQTVTPGSGTRPGDLAEDEEQNLLDTGTTAVGAVWDRYYGMLGHRTNVMAYISSVADRSGDDDCGQASDTLTPLTSAEMGSWSATRWITRVAREHGLAVGGENPGYGLPDALNGHYTNPSAAGMMASALRQARSCGFTVFYWAHDVHLWDGTVPFRRYAEEIARERGEGESGHRHHRPFGKKSSLTPNGAWYHRPVTRLDDEGERSDDRPADQAAQRHGRRQRSHAGAVPASR